MTDQRTQNTTVIEHEVSSIMFTKWLLEGVGLPAVGVVGIFGNIITIYIIMSSNLELKQSFLQLIFTLSIFDSFCIISSITTFSAPLISDYYRLQIFPHLVPYVLPLAQISLTGSVYTILAVASERLLSVSRPYLQIPPYSCLAVSIFILIFSVSVNINRFLEYTTQTITADFPEEVFVRGAKRVDSGTDDDLRIAMKDNDTSRQVPWSWVIVQPTVLRTSLAYSKISTVLSVLFLNLIPFMTLMIINYFIYITIKKKTLLISTSASKTRREFYVATILIIIVTMFGVCHILKCFINLLELISILCESNPHQSWGPNMNFVASLSHLLITVNCSSNFVIYCYKDTKFRATFLGILKRPFKQTRLASSFRKCRPTVANAIPMQTLHVDENSENLSSATTSQPTKPFPLQTTPLLSFHSVTDCLTRHDEGETEV